MMDPREFTYLKRAKELQKEVYELEEKHSQYNEEFNSLLDDEHETNLTIKLSVISDKMSAISEKIAIKEKEVNNLFLMLSN